jgi:O-phosphoseryl-tRNA(Cys) synthetase
LISFHHELTFLFPSMHTLSSSSFTVTLYSQVIVGFWSLSVLYLSLLCPVVLLTIHNCYYKESDTIIYHEGVQET